MVAHLIKLAVGVEDFDHLVQLQDQRARDNAAAGLGAYPRHITRHRPKRAQELLDGGCLYWVIRGHIRARQSIRTFGEMTGEDGVTRCVIVLNRDLCATQPRPHRAFQGWRYLDPAKAPKDASTKDGDLPEDLARDLGDLGLL